MKKIFTLIVACMAIFNTAKAEEIVLFEGSEQLSWSGCIVSTSSITATSDLTLNVTVAHDGKWCQYCICSNVDGWPKVILPGTTDGFIQSGQMTGFTWGTSGTCTNSFELTPELISALTAGGSIVFQGGGGDDGGTITLKKVSVTTKVNYETEGRNITYDEYGSMLASEFNGLSDNAKIVFTYNCAGAVADYQGWGCGQLLSIDSSVDLKKTFPMGTEGDHTEVMTLADVKAALNAGPDQYGRYGLYWNVWGQGDGAAPVTRVSVMAYEVAGFMSDGYKAPDYVAEQVEERSIEICDGNVIAKKDYYFYDRENKVKLVIENTGTESCAYKEIGNLATIDGAKAGRKLYGADGKTFNLYVTVADLIEAEAGSAAAKGAMKAAASSGTKVVLNSGFALQSVTVLKPVDTGIENITAQPEDNGVTYNIAGQRVNSSAKGLVIRNGKKFFVK